MRRKSIYRLVFSTTLLATSAALIVAGQARHHKVRSDLHLDPEVVALLGVTPYEEQEISERELVIQATFTGVVRKGENLVFTYDYDPAHPAGKRACPT